MPAHIETQEIRVLKAVYEEGGFKRAADKLFVTQSAVSQTISNLEKKLDSLLLQRNPLKLTEAGIRMLAYAEAVLSEEQNALSDIDNIKKGVLSTLLLAINCTVNALWGARLMQAYCGDGPPIRLKVSIMPSRQIISAIGSDLWELGFGPFQQQMPPVFECLPLYEEERVLVINRHHPLYTKLKDDPELILRKVPLIISHLDDPDLRPAIEKLRDSFGTIWEINDLALRAKLVMESRGMSYLDRRYIASRADLQDLEVLETLPFARFPLTFGLFYRKNKQLSMAARRFIEICSEFDFGSAAGENLGSE